MSEKRKHFHSFEWKLNTEIVYSVQGPFRSAAVLYHNRLKKYAVAVVDGKHPTSFYPFPDEEHQRFDSMLLAKARAVKAVRGYTEPITVK